METDRTFVMIMNNILKCSECGGSLYLIAENVGHSEDAVRFRFRDLLREDFRKVISLSCYDCGLVYEIARVSSDVVVSRIKHLYSWDEIDSREFSIYKRRLEAERSVFSPVVPPEQEPEPEPVPMFEGEYPF